MPNTSAEGVVVVVVSSTGVACSVVLGADWVVVVVGIAAGSVVVVDVDAGSKPPLHDASTTATAITPEIRTSLTVAPKRLPLPPGDGAPWILKGPCRSITGTSALSAPRGCPQTVTMV